MSETTSLLSVRDLKVSFGHGADRTDIVHGISFDVAPRETAAIVGGSGSGKSVTSMSIMGLLDKRTTTIGGSATLNGRDLLSLPERDMQKVRGNEIGMIFQEPMTSLNPVLTIGYQLAETLKRHRGMSHRAALAEARELLEKVRIPAAARRLGDFPHQMSGGMRQRVMIAMALACKPKLLIADEPTTALDVTVQAQIIDLMQLLQKDEGMAILFVTHDMGVVAEIADRTVVMHHGRIVEQGGTAEIFSRAKDPYTKGLLAAIPRLGSMAGEALPRPFPEIDRATGTPLPAATQPDTVKRDAAAVLTARGLTTRFDMHGGILKRVKARVHAVENIDLTLQPGETLSLVGESGCGKSTLGRSLMRLTEPNSGEVTIAGQSIDPAADETVRNLHRHIQMVFQDPFASLNPRMTVGESIAAPLVINDVMSKSKAAARAGELLELVGLEASMASRYPYEFSGGQRQRICIARALALEPSIIVADEAVSALDVAVKTQVLNLMLKLQAELGLSYLFISHDMAVVERVSHRVAVMYLGEIVEIGSRAAIFDNPVHPYTKKLIAAVPVPDPARRRAPAAPTGGEIRNPVRPVDFVPPARSYTEVSPGHFVMDWSNEEWSEAV